MMNRDNNFDLTVQDPGPTKIINIDNRRSIQQYKKGMIEMYTDFIMQSSVIPKDVDKDEDRKRLALAGAMLKAEYGLDVIAQEAYFIQVGTGNNKRYNLDISYRGITKKKREYELKFGDNLIPGEGAYMSASDIVRLGLHSCRKCGGSGRNVYKGKDQGACKDCSGNGEFDQDLVLHYQIKYSSANDARVAKEVGVDYFPIIGSALWQPCDNIAKNKTSQWMVEKNAYKDVIRRLVPLTNIDDGINPMSMATAEDRSTESIAKLCAYHGVECDDIHSLSNFVRNCVFIADWDSEDEVIAALAHLGIAWKVEREREIKYRVFGYRTSEYPIKDTNILDQDEPVNGILLMNIILDVGGKDAADDISKSLFDVPCTAALTRDQLKQIYESATKDG